MNALFIFCIASAKACSPGALDDVANLKSYLGLVPKHGGHLEWTGYSDDYVTRSTDLKCNFESIDTCRWRNAENGYGDQNDWYLMYKEDARRWPSIIRPGYTALKGNHLMLAGSSSSEANGTKATWISSPIRCQPGVGKLSFAYWTYGKATVEVEAVSLDKVVPYRSVVEMSSNVCSFNQPRGSQCVVQVPRVDQPFQLIITSYTERRREGFVAIDDIDYRADVCSPGKVTAKSEDNIIATAPEPRQYALSSSEANCDFKSVCKWYNVLGDQYDWQLVNGSTDSVDWHFSPDHQAYAALTPETMSAPGKGYLISPAFYCQRGSGQLKFRRYKIGDAGLRVCLHKAGTLDVIYCSGDLSDSSNEAYTLSGPINESFEVRLFGGDTTDALALSDIVYTANVCSDSTVCHALACNFSEGKLCQWQCDYETDNQVSNFQLLSNFTDEVNGAEITPIGHPDNYSTASVSNGNGTIFFIESPVFTLEKVVIMRMQVDQDAWHSELYVCRSNFDQENLNRPSNCQKVAQPPFSTAYSSANVDEYISVEVKKVFIVAKRHQPMAGWSLNPLSINSIDVLDEGGQSLCP